MLQLEYVVVRLADQAATIHSLARDVDAEQARWKPAPDQWSILEVVNHLYDEERLDFRRRLDLLLHRPAAPWPAIDPPGWVTERGYNTRQLAASLDAFLDERQASLAWLRGLADPDWSAYRDHPQAGRLSAGDLLFSWLAHDLLHVRQLAELHWQYLSLQAEPYGVDYAGPW
jgi:hypothetical protein